MILTSKSWDEVQNEYADIPGKEGQVERYNAYKPFFLGMGSDVVIEPNCRFFLPERIILEDDVRINVQGLIYGSGGLRIGRHARIGPRVFIHTANHDVNPNDPRAFFQRGYLYKAVDIGHNVLISADVKILPGTKLGDNSFVGAGAILTGKIFAEKSYLFGIPAKAHEVSAEKKSKNETKSAAQIAIVVAERDSNRWSLFDQILSVLGLPQILLLASEDQVPEDVFAIILDKNAKVPKSVATNVDIWKIAAGGKLKNRGDNKVQIELPDKSEILQLPGQRRLVFRKFSDKEKSVEALAHVLAPWLNDRLTKRSDPLPLGEFLEWGISLILLGIIPGRSDGFLERVMNYLWYRWPTNLEKPNSPLILDSVEKRDAFVFGLFEAVLRTRDTDTPIPLDSQALNGNPDSNWELEDLNKGLMLKYPAILTALVYRDEKGYWKGPKNYTKAVRSTFSSTVPKKTRFDTKICKLLRDLTQHCNTALRTIALGLAAKQFDDEELQKQIVEKLKDPRWYDERTGLMRSINGRKNLLYSPLLLVWWLTYNTKNPLSDSVSELPNNFFDDVEEIELINWQCCQIRSDMKNSFVGQIVDFETKKISRSLPDNWLKLHTAPSLRGHHHVLTDDIYDGSIISLEKIWRNLFTRILHDKKKPVVRLLPWPAPLKAAFSIRYDIDREVKTKRFIELVGMQSELANASFGSWYLKHEQTKLWQRFSTLCELYYQEEAKHIEKKEETVEFKGVTHHSAPTSSYWEGDATVNNLSLLGASYGEFLASELPTPRRALPSQPGTNPKPQTQKPEDQATHMILTALHFPLEGGTNDSDLTYFNQRIDSFRNRLSNGGHVIVGTHPDLNQELFRELFKSEDFSKVWFATVDDVVKRSKSILQNTAIKLVYCDGLPALMSKKSVCDLSVECLHPNGDKKKLVLQILPNQPAVLEMDLHSEMRHE